MRFYQSSGGEHGPPRTGWALIVLAGFLLLCGSARDVGANTIVVSFAGIAAGPAAEWTWSYSASLTGIAGDTSTIVGGPAHAADGPPDPQLGPGDVSPHTGDYFEILDIAGLDVAATTALALPAGWALTIELVTFNYVPPGPSFIDTPLFNVRWSRTGANLVSDAALGTFSLVSLLNTGVDHVYGGNDHKTTGLTVQSNFGLVLAPDAAGPVIGVPLPLASFGGITLFGLLGGIRRRQTRQT